MGLKSEAKVILADLGTRAIIEWLICFKSCPRIKKSWAAAQKSALTTSQDCLKKKED
jgi:hypothetical protein